MAVDQELYQLAERVGRALQAHGWLFATAESCTGGWIAEAMTAVPGSSAWFDRGFITYSNTAKQELLGVPAATLDAHGAVSEATVLAMADGALAHSPAQIVVAVSGIAGPDGGSRTRPVGTVWLAWAQRDGASAAQCRHFDGDRDSVRRQTVLAALHGVLERLEGAVLVG